MNQELKTLELIAKHWTPDGLLICFESNTPGIGNTRIEIARRSDDDGRLELITSGHDLQKCVSNLEQQFAHIHLQSDLS